MSKDITSEVAASLAIETNVADAVIGEFMLLLHRRLVEYDEGNGDYIGEQLRWEISPQAYFHFLGFLDRFSERYGWEPGTAREYIARLFNPAQWQPFSDQVKTWKESSYFHEPKMRPTQEGKNE